MTDTDQMKSGKTKKEENLEEVRTAGKTPVSETESKGGAEELSPADVGYDFFVRYLIIMNDRTKGKLALTKAEKAAVLESDLLFPEMEEIVKEAVASMGEEDEEEGSIKAKRQESLSDLLLACDVIFLNAVSAKEPEEELLQKLGESYLEARDFLTEGNEEKKGKDSKKTVSPEAFEELEKLKREAGSRMDDLSGNGSMQKIFRELLNESEEDGNAAAAAMAILQTAGYNNETDEGSEEIWKKLKSSLAALGLLQGEGESTEDKEENKEREDKFQDELIAGWNAIGEEEASKEETLLKIGDALLSALGKANPLVVSYFLYRYALVRRYIEERAKAEELAKKSGLRGKRAERYVEKKAGLAGKDLEREYTKNDLAFFHGMDVLERRVYRVMSATHLMPVESLPEEGLAWNVLFFILRGEEEVSDELEAYAAQEGSGETEKSE